MSTSQDAAVIAARGLVKRYGATTAVDKLDLTIGPGEIFGLLGPNGSGKTTTILMLLGLTEITEGSISVVGLDPAREPLEVKRQVGYLPDTVGFYDHLSARDNLRYTGRLCGIPRGELDGRIDAALAEVSLSDVAGRRVATFSRGMRQRLGLAEILMKQPRVAILDEPTSGLDPQSTTEFLDSIRRLKGRGMAVLLSSHALQSVQAVCDRVGLFHRGRMVLEGTVAELAARVLGGAQRLEVDAEGVDLGQVLDGVSGIEKVSPAGPNRFALEASRDLRSIVAEKVLAAGGRLLGLKRIEPDLDEIYARYFATV